MGQRLSIREFAKWLSDEKGITISDVAIGKAIKTGKIDRAIDRTNPKRPKIDPELALLEWGKNHDPSYERAPNLSEKINPTNEVERKQAPKPTELTHVEPQEPQTNINSIAEIKRQTAKIKLADAALELKKKQGTLVEKDKVYKALFSMGQEIRSGIQAIPDRCIDDILAASTRNEAHHVLVVALDDFLVGLSEIVNRDINI
jgi:hypothetical protein